MHSQAIVNGKVPIAMPHDSRVQIHLLDENLDPVPEGKIGMLYIQSPFLARGYLNRPKETSENFITTSRIQGPLYKTNDNFTRHGKLLYYQGRVNESNSLKINGVFVNLAEIDNILQQQDNIQTASVVSITNAKNQTKLVAFIVPKDHVEIDLNKLQFDLQASLIEISIPTHYVFMRGLPLTTAGKLNKEVLKEEANRVIEESYRTAPENPPRTPLELELSDIWKEILYIPSKQPIDFNKPFNQLGGFSLQREALINEIKMRFKIDTSTQDLIAFGFGPKRENKPFTIANLAKYIHQKRWQDSPEQSASLLANGNTQRRPIFLIPALTGEGPPTYQCLAEELHKSLDTKIYALTSRGIFNKYDIHADIEELAEDFVRVVTILQPHDKVILMGWSFGGILAYKMTGLFESKGREVKFLGMLDTLAPSVYQKMSRREFAEEINTIVTHLISILESKNAIISERVKIEELEKFDKKQQVELVFNQILDQVKNNYLLYNLIYTSKVNILSTLNYLPQKTKITPYQYNTESSQEKYANTRLGWKGRRSHQTTDLPGDHFSILSTSEHLEILIEEVENHLKGKLGSSPTPASDDSDSDKAGTSPPQRSSLAARALELSRIVQELYANSHSSPTLPPPVPPTFSPP